MSGETDILVARRGALIHHDGRLHTITRGKTTVRAGHAILEDHGDLFEPLMVDFDLPRQQAKPVETKQGTEAAEARPQAGSAAAKQDKAPARGRSGGEKDA